MNVDRIFPNIRRLNNSVICLKKAKLFAISALAWLIASVASMMEKHHAMGVGFTVIFFACGVLYGLKAYALYSRSRSLGNGLF